jgi:hypothetical protein
MPFDDLDLEFEDEEESKKKKNEAVHVDVDLEFHTPEGAKARPQPVARPAAPAGTAPNIQRPAGIVRKIDDARPAGSQQVRRSAPVSNHPQVSAPRSVGSNALKDESHYDVESEQVVELREKMRKVEFDAEVKVQVAEFKIEILSELLGDMKLMEHQIGQLLARINAKHPDMKNEALMIKKILADFTAKKRK